MDAETGRLIASFRAGNVIRHGVSVAIVGKPNAGKSTLLNTLLNENRAIVSEIAGTTRDTIEEVLNIDGILFRLIDTAGIRSHTADRVEREGIQRSLDKIRTAELVLYLFDATDPDPDINAVMRDLQGQQVRFLLVINKTDLIGEQEARYRFASAGEAVYLSAREGHHIEVLRERMVDQVLGGAVEQEHTIVTNARHYHALCQVQESLAAIRNGMEQRLSGDLLAPDIRRCLHYLGEITGEVTTEDQLDYIFSKFCIGK
jgi:tRNA modification GTPase